MDGTAGRALNGVSFPSCCMYLISIFNSTSSVISEEGLMWNESQRKRVGMKEKIKLRTRKGIEELRAGERGNKV